MPRRKPRSQEDSLVNDESPIINYQTNSVRLVNTISLAQYRYLEEIAGRDMISPTTFVSDLIRKIIRDEIQQGKLDFNLPVRDRENADLKVLLKAILYGELSEDEKITLEKLSFLASSLGCEPRDLVNLIDSKHQDSNQE